MSIAEWLARRVTLPLYERAMRRPTFAALDELTRLADLTPAQLEEEIRRRVGELLRFAAANVPYYAARAALADVDPRGSDSLAELRKLPVIDKAEIRAHAEALVYPAVPGGPIPHCSGGTTGDRLHFYIDRVRQSQPMAARLFCQRLFGVEPGDRRIYVWGSPLETRGWSGLPARVRRGRDRLLNEVMLDAFDLSAEQMDAYLARIRAFRPRLIYGYPTAVARLAEHAARAGRAGDVPSPRVVVLTGEEVTAEQRARVASVFGCPVASEYGSREVGLIAHECPRGGMHVISPHVLVEVVHRATGRAVQGPAGRVETGRRAVLQQPVRPGTASRGPISAVASTGGCGDIVCTTLCARAQPFLRYRLGDVGALEERACACGLPFPLLRLLGGKITGFIALPGGRICHGAVTSHVLRGEAGIVEFKTQQRSLRDFEVLLVVDSRFDPRAPDRIAQRYRALFGEEIRVACRVVPRIAPDPSGKRRYVVSDVAPQYDAFDVVEAP